MLYPDEIRVALLGRWVGIDEWQIEFKNVLKELQDKYCPNIDFLFSEATPPSKVGFFPHNLWDNITIDLRLAQEQLLAFQSDIVIYVNDGHWPKYKKRHLDNLERKCGCLIAWTPDSIQDKEEMLDEEDEAGLRPGAVALYGDMKRLAEVLLFVSLKGEEDLHEY